MFYFASKQNNNTPSCKGFSACNSSNNTMINLDTVMAVSIFDFVRLIKINARIIIINIIVVLHNIISKIQNKQLVNIKYSSELSLA